MAGIRGFNTSTILLMATIRELADMAYNGFLAFSEYHGNDDECYGKIIYDDTKDCYNHVSDDDVSIHAYKIVANKVVDDVHHDVVDTYDDWFEGVVMHVMIDDDGYDDDDFIEVSFGEGGRNGVIVLRNGSYYVDYYGE